MVRTRFAPSPTGKLHVGGLRTALYNWAYARHYSGQFFLRIEDTDTQRNKEEARQGIVDSLQWAGLLWDGVEVYQSDNIARYQELARTLVDQGLAYVEDVSSVQKGDPHRPYRGVAASTQKLEEVFSGSGKYVVRANIQSGPSSTWTDMVKGTIPVDASLVEDWILIRSNGMPTYNFAVVVDDHDMEITHVIRGDDHVSNTPKQLLLYQAFGWDVPVFGHVPMIQDAQGKKLSKRTIEAVATTQSFPVDVPTARAEGLCPSALNNYMARLGWSNGNEEVFSMVDFVRLFDGSGLQSSPAKVDPKKLHWLNAVHLKHMDDQKLLQWAFEQPKVVKTESFSLIFSKISDDVRSRGANTTSILNDCTFLSRFVTQELVTPTHAGAQIQTTADTKDPLVLSGWLHWTLPKEWYPQMLDQSIRQAAELSGCSYGALATSIRQVLSTEKVTPPIGMMLAVKAPTAISTWLHQVQAQLSTLRADENLSM